MSNKQKGGMWQTWNNSLDQKKKIIKETAGIQVQDVTK